MNVQLFSTPQKSSSRFASKDALVGGQRPPSSRSMFYPADDYRFNNFSKRVSGYASPAPLSSKINQPSQMQQENDVFSIAMLNPPIAYFDNQD
jgi:hypothetical protein